MNSGIAALPMYDWPELHAPMDHLWAEIAHELRNDGMKAPAQLARELPYDASWTRPDLVLGQTCGLPMATTLANRVSVVGTFDLALQACPPGHYRSALLVRAGSDIDCLENARGRRLVINNLDSQSGFHSVMGQLRTQLRTRLQTQLLDPMPTLRFFSSVAVSDAHRNSIAWLLDGRADIAAIDCHSLALARRFGPSPDELRIVGYTPAVPGTPLITAQHANASRIGDAVERALQRLDTHQRRELGIAGLWRCDATDYQPLADAGVARLAQRELGLEEQTESHH